MRGVLWLAEADLLLCGDVLVRHLRATASLTLTLTDSRFAASFTTLLYAFLMAAVGDNSSTGSAGGEGACGLTEAQASRLHPCRDVWTEC